MQAPTVPSTDAWDTRDHFVQFYEHEPTLMASLGEFVHRAIAGDGAAIVVASASHVDALEQELRRRALDVAGARETRRLVVLLTDGASNAGPDPIDAARQAADRGLRIYTIGFGTANPGGRPPFCGIGSEPGDNGQFDPGGNFGGGFGGGGFGGTGGGFRRAIDENTLTAIADATGGKYYPAESAEQLNDVFQKLPTNLIVSHEVVEVSVAFVAIGTVLLALAILLGQRWRPLP